MINKLVILYLVRVTIRIVSHTPTTKYEPFDSTNIREGIDEYEYMKIEAFYEDPDVV